MTIKKHNTIGKQKEYIIVYRSQEHYEVLGYVKALSLEQAQKKAVKKLLPEAKYYGVTTAEIDEIARFDKLTFKI